MQSFHTIVSEMIYHVPLWSNIDKLFVRLANIRFHCSKCTLNSIRADVQMCHLHMNQEEFVTVQLELLLSVWSSDPSVITKKKKEHQLDTGVLWFVTKRRRAEKPYLMIHCAVKVLNQEKHWNIYAYIQYSIDMYKYTYTEPKSHPQIA